MALSAADVDELISLLQRDPVLKDRVRNAILAEDFLALPGIVARLGERIDTLTQRIDTLTERMDALTGRIDALTQRLDSFVVETREQFANVNTRLNRLEGKVGNLQGGHYELNYYRNLGSRLGRRFDRVRPVQAVDLPGIVEARDSGVISEEEWEDVLLIDSAAFARPRETPEREVVVMLELSLVVDVGDVNRAYRRAEIVRKAGLDAQGCVDGESILPEAKTEAARLGVVLLVSKEGVAA